MVFVKQCDPCLRALRMRCSSSKVLYKSTYLYLYPIQYNIYSYAECTSRPTFLWRSAYHSCTFIMKYEVWEIWISVTGGTELRSLASSGTNHCSTCFNPANLPSIGCSADSSGHLQLHSVVLDLITGTDADDV